MADDPLLSIVVTIVDGGTYTRDFLDALRRLEDAPPLEIITGEVLQALYDRFIMGAWRAIGFESFIEERVDFVILEFHGHL